MTFYDEYPVSKQLFQPVKSLGVFPLKRHIHRVGLLLIAIASVIIVMYLRIEDINLILKFEFIYDTIFSKRWAMKIFQIKYRQNV